MTFDKYVAQFVICLLALVFWSVVSIGNGEVRIVATIAHISALASAGYVASPQRTIAAQKAFIWISIVSILLWIAFIASFPKNVAISVFALTIHSASIAFATYVLRQMNTQQQEEQEVVVMTT